MIIIDQTNSFVSLCYVPVENIRLHQVFVLTVHFFAKSERM